MLLHTTHTYSAQRTTYGHVDDPSYDFSLLFFSLLLLCFVLCARTTTLMAFVVVLPMICGVHQSWAIRWVPRCRLHEWYHFAVRTQMSHITPMPCTHITYTQHMMIITMKYLRVEYASMFGQKTSVDCKSSWINALIRCICQCVSKMSNNNVILLPNGVTWP